MAQELVNNFSSATVPEGLAPIVPPTLDLGPSGANAAIACPSAAGSSILRQCGEPRERRGSDPRPAFARGPRCRSRCHRWRASSWPRPRPEAAGVPRAHARARPCRDPTLASLAAHNAREGRSGASTTVGARRVLDRPWLAASLTHRVTLHSVHGASDRACADLELDARRRCPTSTMRQRCRCILEPRRGRPRSCRCGSSRTGSAFAARRSGRRAQLWAR